MFFQKLKKELLHANETINEIDRKFDTFFVNSDDIEIATNDLERKKEEAVNILESAKNETESARSKIQHNEEHTLSLMSLMKDIHEHIMAMRVHSRGKFNVSVFDEYISLPRNQISPDQVTEKEPFMRKVVSSPEPTTPVLKCPSSYLQTLSPNTDKDKFISSVGLATPPPPEVAKHIFAGGQT